MAAEHEPRTVGSSRDAGGKRTVFYAVCRCGAGTTNSANPESARAKIAAHAAGDNRGIVASTLTPSDVSTNVPRTLEGTQHLELVAQAAQAATRAREELEAAIVAARRDKVSLRAIADAAGLSHEHVRRLTTTEEARP